ncbi:MAG TPA: hypothetical protein PKE12_06075 [Kiritimatiellia bacterium]|nr:hypothetical protein [Kiritimatiellia bacterium]
MDAGKFFRSPVCFWLWIALPIALMVLATVPTAIHLDRATRGMNEREALLDQLPLDNRRVRTTSELLAATTPVSARHAEAAQEATRRIDEFAARAGLTIRTLKVAEGLQQEGGLQVVTLQVQVQGSLRGIVQWMDELQRPGLLLDFSAGSLNASSITPDGPATGDFRLALCLRST